MPKITRITSFVICALLLGISFSIPVNAVNQECVLYFFNCQDKPASKAVNDIFNDIDLQETKTLEEGKKNEIKSLLTSDDKKQVEKGFEELFNVSVKNDYNLYIQGKASKDNTKRLRKFYDGIELARKPLDRDFTPMVNTWGMLANGVNFGSYVVSSLFLDIQTQLPDVFGKFDYKDTSKPVSDKAKQAFSLEAGGKLSLDGIQTLNLNDLYYKMLTIVLPIFGLILLIKYATKGFYEWSILSKMLTEVVTFFVFIVLAPSLVSFSILFTNTATSGMQQLFSSSTVTEGVCKDDRSMLCAYKESFTSLANSEAIYARSSQFYTMEEDSIKAVGNFITEFFTNALMILLYALNIIFGLLVLLFWKGAVMMLLVTLIFMTVILPFAIMNPKWRMNWFNKALRIQLTIFGFTLFFNLATQLVLAVSTGGLAYWSISFVFLVAAFVIFQAMPLIGEIFGINLSFQIRPERQIKALVASESERLQAKSGLNAVRRGARSTFGETKPYKAMQQAKNYIKNFGKKR